MLSVPSPEDIKKKRKELKLTQSELAKLAGVSQPLVARIEAGNVDPRRSTLEKVVRVLNEIQGKKVMAKDIMHSPVVSVLRDDSLNRAMGLMEDKGISQLPVLDNGSPVGSISVDTVSMHILNQETEDIAHMKAGDVMEAPFPSIPPTMEVQFVSHLLEAMNAVLVYEYGKVVGILTKHDLMKLVSERQSKNKKQED
ncbi:MAG: CBS domain-containing protein [Methermicoccaceae archaeon]